MTKRIQPRALALFLFSIFALCPRAMAGWEKHEELPEWARRGHVCWTMAYGTIRRPRVEVMIALHQNLEHGNHMADESVRRFAEEHGIRNMQYICSRTIYWQRLFEKEPRLKKAYAVGRDGKPLLMYFNPGRYPGCYNNPIWVDYIKKRTKEVYDTGTVSAIFYDNTSAYHCYCSICRKKFAEYSLRKVGRSMGLPERISPATLEGRVAMKFEADCTVEFFTKIKEYARSLDRGLLICPNHHWSSAWHQYLIGRGVPDIVFFEENPHPPYSMRHFGYKLSLATSRGKVCGQAIYLPVEEYGRSLLPSEFALGIAEAWACDGVYIVNMNPSHLLPRDVNSPVIKEGKKYFDFIKENEELYREARPAAPLAIVYPYNSSLWKRSVMRTATYAVAEKLRLAGLPYEIITEDDLEAQKLKPFSLVVLPEVEWLPEEKAKGLLDYVTGGGNVILSGNCGTFDEFGEPCEPPPSLTELLAGVPVARTYRASGLNLETFYIEGQKIRLNSGAEGVAWLNFPGEEGDYSISVKYLDEHDGVSYAEIRAAGSTLKGWKFDADDDKIHQATVEKVHLRRGDRIEIKGRSERGEMCRIYQLSVGPPTSEAVSSRRVGRGHSLYLPTGLEAMDDSQMLALMNELNGIPVRLLDTSPDLFINLLRTAEDEPTVHLVNYGLRYSNTARIADRGLYAWERWAYLSSEDFVARKVFDVEKPDDFVAPGLRIRGDRVRSGDWQLSIIFNGAEIYKLSPDEITLVWLTLPLKPGLLKRGRNTVELRCVGKVDKRHCYRLGIGIYAKTRNSSLSIDGGKSFSTNDISPSEEGEQTGEYAIAIADTALTAAPDVKRNLRISLDGLPVREAVLLVPAKRPIALRVENVDGKATVVVPELEIYAVIKLMEK